MTELIAHVFTARYIHASFHHRAGFQRATEMGDIAIRNYSNVFIISNRFHSIMCFELFDCGGASAMPTCPSDDEFTEA